MPLSLAIVAGLADRNAHQIQTVNIDAMDIHIQYKNGTEEVIPLWLIAQRMGISANELYGNLML